MMVSEVISDFPDADSGAVDAPENRTGFPYLALHFKFDGS
jgi:hypothetical protein